MRTVDFKKIATATEASKSSGWTVNLYQLTFCISTVLVALAMASGCPCSSMIKDLTAFSTSLSDCRVAMTTDLSLSFVITVIKVGMAVPSIRCTKKRVVKVGTAVPSIRCTKKRVVKVGMAVPSIQCTKRRV